MANVNQTVKIEGVKQLEKNLLYLQKLADSRSPASRAINNALNKGLNPIQKEAKRRTPEDKGQLKRALKKKRVNPRQRNMFMRILGYARSFKMTKNKISGQAEVNYAGIQEEGGGYGENKQGKHMLEKAFEARKRQVIKATIDDLQKQIYKEIRKLPLYR